MEKEQLSGAPMQIHIFWLFPLCLHLLWDIYFVQIGPNIAPLPKAVQEVKDQVSEASQQGKYVVSVFNLTKLNVVKKHITKAPTNEKQVGSL